jgi:hypothetical protein
MKRLVGKDIAYSAHVLSMVTSTEDWSELVSRAIQAEAKADQEKRKAPDEEHTHLVD